jgi:putative addiction module CopG family antidote
VNDISVTVRLTPKLKKFVEGRIRSGRYSDYTEVIRDALRALEHADRGEARDVKKLIEEGFSSGPAEPLTRDTWSSIWKESEIIARTLRRKRKAAA